MEKNPYAPPTSSLDGSLELSPAAASEDSEYRELGRLSVIVSRLLLIGVIFSLLSAGSSLMQLRLLSSVGYSKAQAAANDIREQLIHIGHLLVYTTTVLFFGRWIYLAHRNLPALGARYLKFRPGWAVGSFFVPIVNLWMPFQAMRDLAKASRSPQAWELEDTPPQLIFWWVLWIVVSQLGNAVMRAQFHLNTVAQLSELTRLDLAQEVLSVPLALLAWHIVRRVSRDQVESYSRLTHGAPDGTVDLRGDLRADR